MEAVGICKACNKGICAECAADLGHSIACKSSRCEEKAILMDAALKGRLAAIKTARIIPVFSAIMGSGFIYYGIDGYPTSEFTLMIGIGFLVFGGIHYLAMRKWTPDLEKKALK